MAEDLPVSRIDGTAGAPAVHTETSIQDDLNDILDQIGHEHRKWPIDL